jgi:DegV family protein with EDD domain
MRIGIVADSTCDLPQDMINEFDIRLVSLYLNFGDKGYLDGIEMSRKEFYDRLPTSYPLPTTAAPGQGAFLDVYQRLAEEGAEEILSIHISRSLSAMVEVAQSAANQFDQVPVTVFDSQQLSLGTGFIVQAAAEYAEKGNSLEEIVEFLIDLSSRTYVFAALETLEFLKRSGRMNRVVANLGNILRIKPILKMNKGQPTAERVRTRERALKRVIQLTEELGSLEQLALVHTNTPQGAKELGERAKHLFPDERKPLSVDVTPVIGAHIGPGVVGFACVAKK